MHPFFSFGGLLAPVASHSLFQAMAFLSGILLGIYNAPKVGISRTRALDASVWVVISAILGARVLYIICFPHQFPTVGSLFEFKSGGQVFFGGFLGTLIAAIIYTRYHRMSFRDSADLVAPSLGLGHFFGRVGCFLGGCCYGGQTAMPWGVVFPDLDGARHPTQLYEAAFVLFLGFWTHRMLNERVRLERAPVVPAAPALSETPVVPEAPALSETPVVPEAPALSEAPALPEAPAATGTPAMPSGPAASPVVPGRIGGLYLLAYGCFRFSIEFIRDDRRGSLFPVLQLSPSQLISVAAVLGALVWMAFCTFQARRETVKEGR